MMRKISEMKRGTENSFEAVRNDHGRGSGTAKAAGTKRTPEPRINKTTAAVIAAVVAVVAIAIAVACIAVRTGNGRAVKAQGRPVLKLSKDEPAPGETIVLTIGYEADEVITGSKIIVEFGSKLEYVSSDKDKMLADTVSWKESSPNTVTILQAEGNGTNKGTLCTITLKVADNAPRDVDEEIVLRMAEYSDENYENFYPDTTFRKKIYIPATPRPTATSTPTPTPTPVPTATATPTVTPTKTPTSTPDPTKTPTPTVTATKTPTPTANPTKTPEPTRTPEPTGTNIPTPSEPAETQTPTSDASPDYTNDPNAPATDTGTPGPGETPLISGEFPSGATPDVQGTPGPGETPDASLSPVPPSGSGTSDPGSDVPTAETQPTAGPGTEPPEKTVPTLPGGDPGPDGGSFLITRRNMMLWVFAASIAGIWIGVAVGFLVWGRKGRKGRKNDYEKSRGRDVFIVILAAAMLFGLGRMGSLLIGNNIGSAVKAATDQDALKETADPAAETPFEDPEATAPSTAPETADNTDDPAHTPSDATPGSTNTEDTPTPDNSTPTEPATTPGQEETPTPGTDETPTEPADKTPTQGEATGATPDDRDTPGPDETPDVNDTEGPATESPTPDITAVPTEVPTRTPYPTRTPTAVPEATTPPTLARLTPPPLNDATRIPSTDEKGNIITVTDAPVTTAKTEHVGMNEENTTYRLSDFIQTLCYIAYGLAAILLLIGVIRIIWLLVFKKDIVPPAPQEDEGKKKKRRLNKNVNTDDVEVSHNNWN
ncbi:MAG: hypothetical protein IKH41_03950 [Clostridia bacterium]|nr:hypothetical protein [Clostridia bacterium]